MEALLTSPSSISSIPATFSVRHPKNPSQNSPFSLPFPIKPPENLFLTTFSPFPPNSCSSSPLIPRASLLSSSSPSTASLPFASSSSSSAHRRHWMVLTEDPPQGHNSKPQIVDYYVRILQRVLGSEIDAQMCIYDASCSENFGFCCDIDQDAADELARIPGVLSVRPDLDINSTSKEYSCSHVQSGVPSSICSESSLLFSLGTSKRWIVCMEKPPIVLITKAQIVDYYTQVLTKVLGNETDAQMCIYHVSTDSNYGFCCELDDACAQELAGVPGVLSIHLDENFESDDKDYGGEKLNSGGPQDSSLLNQVPNIRTKKLFVTGLSFYTSEKTLRAAFEGFGELVEVKVIMDKISKRSKGYAFVEYTTEDSAATALREMNGKIINGWMITVDVAKKKSSKTFRRTI